MNEFKLCSVFNVLVIARSSGSEHDLMGNIAKSMDPTPHIGYIKKGDGSFNSNIKRGVAGFPDYARDAIRAADFYQQVEKVNENVLPIIKGSQEKVENALLQLLKDDNSIPSNAHIGPNLDKFKKASILEYSLDFVELLTGVLYYTIVNFESCSVSKTELLEYIHGIFVLSNENRRLFPHLGTREQNIHLKDYLRDEIRCKSYLRIGGLIRSSKCNLIDFDEQELEYIIDGIKAINEERQKNWRITNAERISQIIEQINQLENDTVDIATDSYQAFYDSIINFYKNKNSFFHALIIIGVCTGNPDLENDVSFDALENISDDLMINIDFLVELMRHDNDKGYQLETRYDHIYKFLLNHDTATKDVDNTEYVCNLISFFADNCNTLKKAKQITELLIEENRITANNDILRVLKAFRIHWKDMNNEKMYNMCLKYRMWPYSLWGNEQLFEDMCVDNIEAIIRVSSNRQEAVKLSELSLKISEKLGKDKDIQIFSRVAFEFSTASNKEFRTLKRQIMESDKEKLT